MRLHPVDLAAIYFVNGHTPKNGRRPQTRPFPYNGCLPLALRNHVSNKTDKYERKRAPCVYEMSEFLACAKKYDFVDKMCIKEMESLKTCYKTYRVTTDIRKNYAKEGTLVPGESKLSAKQLNVLLTKYQQPNVDPPKR